MNRKQAETLIRVAGYHGDTQSALIVYVDNRISFGNYQKQYRVGQQMKVNGMKCDCAECNFRDTQVEDHKQSMAEEMKYEYYSEIRR